MKRLGLWLAGCWLISGCAHAPMAAVPDAVLTPAESVTLGDTYMQQKETALAERQYRKALEVDWDYVPALVALGNMAFEAKDYRKAEKYFNKARKASPKDPAVLNNVAMVRLVQGKELKGLDIELEDAVTHAGAAAPYLWDTLARIALIEGRYADAKDALQKATETAPSQDPAFEKRLQESRQELASVAPAIASQ